MVCKNISICVLIAGEIDGSQFLNDIPSEDTNQADRPALSFHKRGKMKMEKDDRQLKESDKAETDHQAPEVYAVKRGASGWRLSRRDIMQAAAAAVAASILPEAGSAQQCSNGARPHYKRILSLAFSPSGKMFISGSEDGRIKIWSLPDGALLKTLQADYAYGNVTISPDGRLLASSSLDKTVKIWSFPDGALLKTLPGHTDYVRSVAISPNGQILVSGSDDKTIKIWSLPDGALLKTLQGHTSLISAIAISPNGQILATASYDNTIKIWALPDGVLLKTLQGTDIISSIAISPDGKTLVSSMYYSRYPFSIWALADGLLLNRIQSEYTSVSSIAISPDGRLLASGNINSVTIRSFPDGALLKTLKINGEIRSIAISPDGSLLASACDATTDFSIRLWTLPDGLPIEKCLMDVASSDSTAKAVQYKINDTVYTLPDGFPIPPGAVCTCNSVQGSYCPCVSTGGGYVTYYYPN
jgi:WD40 repeat protein